MREARALSSRLFRRTFKNSPMKRPQTPPLHISVGNWTRRCARFPSGSNDCSVSWIPFNTPRRSSIRMIPRSSGASPPLPSSRKNASRLRQFSVSTGRASTLSYYRGAFPQYARISGTETPIYVGEASPAVPNARTAFEQSDKLFGRLTDHRKNIAKAVTTLNVDDFDCRMLRGAKRMESAAEEFLIRLFRAYLE